MHARVLDLAGSARTLAIARPPAWPSAQQTASAPGTKFISRLNGWPTRSPADASPTPSRVPAHGSGPMRIATPSSWWTCNPELSLFRGSMAGLHAPLPTLRRHPRGRRRCSFQSQGNSFMTPRTLSRAGRTAANERGKLRHVHVVIAAVRCELLVRTSRQALALPEIFESGSNYVKFSAATRQRSCGIMLLATCLHLCRLTGEPRR